ncbi:MAG TPA: hypothetical protein VGG84_03995 [Gemmatimonadaceae bacterium]
MRLSVLALAAFLSLSLPARAQYTTTCVHHTSRVATCTTVRDPQPPPRQSPDNTPPHPSPTIATSQLADQVVAASGVWRASHVVFGGNGGNVPLEIRVIPLPRGVRLEIPEVLKLPGGQTVDLMPIDARTYRATDAAGHVTTFRVLGPQRADLIVTGNGGSGAVTFQLDQHAPL